MADAPGHLELPPAPVTPPSAGRIGVKAVAVCRHAGRVLVERGRDRVAGTDFYRAIGGSVEFGERAADAVAREWREEYGLELRDPRLLGVLESVFTYEGRPGHEVVFVFGARVAQAEVYERDAFDGVDPEGKRHQAAWVPLAELMKGAAALYPAGMLALLAEPGER